MIKLMTKLIITEKENQFEKEKPNKMKSQALFLAKRWNQRQYHSLLSEESLQWYIFD